MGQPGMRQGFSSTDTGVSTSIYTSNTSTVVVISYWSSTLLQVSAMARQRALT